MNSSISRVLNYATAAGTFCFVYIIGTVLLLAFHLSGWIAPIASLIVAIVATRYVWMNSTSLADSPIRSVAIGALVAGGIGLGAGFLGPLIFARNANEGRLLGLFITGPIGFGFGAIGGGIYWYLRHARSVWTAKR